VEDRELSVEVLALGVGEYHPRTNEAGIHVSSYSGLSISGSEIRGSEKVINSKITTLVTPYDKFVRDWRVVGALMEKVRKISVEAWCKLLKRLMHEFDSRELPRAIIEACVMELQDNES